MRAGCPSTPALVVGLGSKYGAQRQSMGTGLVISQPLWAWPAPARYVDYLFPLKNSHSHLRRLLSGR